MKKIFLILILILQSLTLAFTFTSTVFAEGEYTLLAPLPCISDQNCNNVGTETKFQDYLPGVFNFSIGLAAVLAFAVISYGGFLYMTTDSIFGKEDGKKHITDAIYGLLLVIGAWSILYTINPQILKFDLNIQKPEFKGSSSVTSGNGGTSNITEQAARQALGGYEIKSSAQVAGLQQGTIDMLVALKLDCGTTCVPTITSGTEGAHTTNSAHYSGTGVDMTGDKLSTFIRGGGDGFKLTNTNSEGCQTYNGTVGGKAVTALWEPDGAKCGGTVASKGAHWHVSTQ